MYKFCLLVTLEDGTQVAYGFVNQEELDYWETRYRESFPTTETRQFKLLDIREDIFN